MRPSLGRLGVIFDVGQASKANQSRLTFYKNHSLDWLALEAWPTSKMTPNLPKLGLIIFLLVSRTHKKVAPNIPKIWHALVYIRQCQNTLHADSERSYCIHKEVSAFSR